MAGSEGLELVLVDTVEEVENFLRWLGERRPVLAFDLETTGLDPWRDHTRMCQFGDAQTGWAIPYEEWRGVVRHALSVYERPLVAHNAKFDTSMLEQDGVMVPRHLVHDTMTMCHLVDSHGPKGLKPAANRYVAKGAGGAQHDLKEAMRKNHWTWETIPTDYEEYWEYAALDTVITARLAEALWPRTKPYRSAYELEIDVTWVLLDMEQRGVTVDVEYCESERERLLSELEVIEARWPGVNLHSSEQVIHRLQQDGVTLTKKTESGSFSTDKEVLESIGSDFSEDVLGARERLKVANTYLANYLKYEVDGVLHCNINPLGAEKTGRMSISRPSFQNIPRTRQVRGALTARPGNRLLLIDYQAQETRLVAHFANDPELIRAFNEGLDVHTYVASLIYQVPMEEVAKEQRRKAKQGGHARNYGAGASKLALTVDVSVPEAAAFIKAYDRQFAQIPELHRKLARAVKDRAVNGWSYIRTYGGRDVKIPMKKSYVAMNYLIQGSGSDVLKKGMVNAARNGVSEYLVLPVHDETVWDVPEAGVEDALVAIRECMELDDLRVPLPVEHKVVTRWGDAYS